MKENELMIIETIRAEIERLMDEYKPIVGGIDETTGAHIVLAKLLSFLDTLESEKPMNPNKDVFKIWGTTEKEYLAKSMDKVHLEMEIATYLKDWEDDEEIGLHLSTDHGCIQIELEDVRDLARHFAQWGIKSQEKKIADAYEKGKQDGIRVVRSWESSPGQGGY